MRPTSPDTPLDDPVLERLDRISQLLELALAPQLDVARERIRADQADAAIFDLTAGDWIAAATLQKEVEKRTNVKKRSFQRHIGKLVKLGFVRTRGATKTLEYRSSGLV